MKLTEHIILLSQFHLTKNEKNAGEYTSGENKKIWWQCPVAFDHVWPARFADRIQVFKRRGNETYEDGGTVGCPFCAPNSKPSSTNNLELLRPEIAQEWDCEANHPLTPKEVTIKSSQIVSWICAKGHKYTSTVYDRTRGDRPHSCPDCSSKNSSPEFRIVAELKLIFSEIQHRKRIEHLEADIFIPELNLAIEYDGGYYHTSTSKDRQKNEFFRGKGIQLIRIRQGNLKKISALDVVETSSSIKKSTVNRLLHSIQKIFPFAKEKKAIEEYIELDELQNNTEYFNLLANIKSSKPEDSLMTHLPQLLDRWDYDRNGNLNPQSISAGDDRLTLFFVCPKHGNYKRTAYSVTKLVNPQKSLGCSKCSGRVASATRNLAVLFPKLTSQLASDLNGGLNPVKISPGSSRNLLWRCEKGHVFPRIVKHRTKNGENDPCPLCKSHPKARQ